MKNLSLLLLLFLSLNILYAQNLENDIYNATDIFNTKKTFEALEHLNENITSFESKLSSIDEYLAFIHLLINKAYFLFKQNRNSTAISTYEKAWQLYKEKDIASQYEYDIIDNCMIPLGILYNKVGDYTSSENITKNYINLAKKTKNNPQLITGFINLSRLYQTLSRHQQAIDIANYGLSIKSTNTQQKSKLKRIKSRSQVSLNQTVTRIDKVKINLNWISGNIENKELAYELAMQKKDYPLALNIFNSLKHLKKDKLSSASFLSKLYLEEAQLYYLLNEHDTAIKTLNTALKILLPDYDSNNIPKEINLYPENAFIGIFDLYAVLQINPKNALSYYSLSFYVSDLLAKNTTSQEGKLILLNEKRNRSEKCLELLYSLQNTNNNSNYTIEALKLSERYKAYVLKEIIGEKELLKLHPKDNLLIEQQTLLKRQEQLTNRLIKTPYNANTNQKTEIRSKLSEINIELKKLDHKIENKYPNTIKDSLNIGKLSSKLKEDKTTLIEFFYGKRAIYQIVFSETSTQFNKIPLNEITQNSISGFIDYFDDSSVINNDIPKYTKDAFNLYKILKLDLFKDKKNIVIIPDGFLNFIPFDALLTEKTNTIKFKEMSFVVKSHKLAYHSNLALYLKENKQSDSKKILGVFPVFENSNLELKHSIDEAKSIENEMDIILLMNEQATKEAFINQSKVFNILHLSTHASSGNFIEPAHIEFSDSRLYLNELYLLNLNTDLVVLSACETGVGVSQRGEGVMSIARGFQYAGAKNILFSLWQISDLSTSQLMSFFYKKYDACSSAFEANNYSKLAYLNDAKIKNIKKSPYYWSAFTYHGSIVSPKENRLNLILILLVSTGIILLLLLFYRSKYGK